VCLAAAVVFIGAQWSASQSGEAVAILTAELTELRSQLHKREADVEGLLRERALRGETNGVLFDRTRPSTASSAQQTLAHTTPLPTRTATTNGPLTPRAAPRPSSGVVAHTTVRGLPAAASVTSTKPLSVADGSAGAGGKISPESTFTRCTGAAAQPETSEVTFIVQNPRCDGYLSRLLQWNVGSPNSIVFYQCATVLSVRVCPRCTAPLPTCVAARCPLTVNAETQLSQMISRLLFWRLLARLIAGRAAFSCRGGFKSTAAGDSRTSGCAQKRWCQGHSVRPQRSLTGCTMRAGRYQGTRSLCTILGPVQTGGCLGHSLPHVTVCAPWANS
jgi:hypothetical protein